MTIFDKKEGNKIIIDYKHPITLSIFTDSASYRRPDGIFDSNVGYFIYQEQNLLYCKRRDYKNKTNNFGELKAIELALKYVEKSCPSRITNINIYSDSLLSIKCLTEYLEKWLENAVDGVLYNSRQQPVKNQDIILSILDIEKKLNKRKIQINIYFIRSHSPKYKEAEYHRLFCNDNNVNITLEEYKIIRERNAFCDAFIKNE